MNELPAGHTIDRDAHELVATAVTALFVPGDRPDRFTKAVRSGADVVIIDLEDAVRPEVKVQALHEVLTALSPRAAAPIRALVRVNAIDSPTHLNEIRMLIELTEHTGHGVQGIVVPKAEKPNQMADLAAQLAKPNISVALVPLVESALGLVNAVELAGVPGVTRLALGAIDLALDLDADDQSAAMDYGRAHVVVASRAAGIASPLDSPSVAIKDVIAVEASARIGRAGGFGGKLCIHPAQIRAVRTAFAPTDEQISWAQMIIAVGDSAVQVNGQMVDRPVLAKAHRILLRAGA